MVDKPTITTDEPRDFGEAIDPNMPWNRRKRVAEPTPEAFMVTKLDGTDRRIIDAAVYDPRSAKFWINAEAQVAHLVIPLIPTPATRAED